MLARPLSFCYDVAMTFNTADYSPPINEFTLPGELAHDGCGEVCVSYAAACHGHPVTVEQVASIMFGSSVPGFTTGSQLAGALSHIEGGLPPIAEPPFQSGDIVACYCLPDGSIVSAVTPNRVGHWVLVLDTDAVNVVVANPAGGSVQLLTQDELMASYQGGLSLVRTGSVLPTCLISHMTPHPVPEPVPAPAPQGDPTMPLLDERDQLNAFFQLTYNVISTFRDHKFAIPSDAMVEAFITEAQATGSVAQAIAHTIEAQK